MDKLQVSFQVHFPGASPEDKTVPCRNSPSGESLHIMNGGEKTCFNFCNFRFSVSTSERLSVGFVYSTLKSVGNSCYFGRLQAMCRVIFLQQHWVSFISIPKIFPSFCKGSIYLSLPLLFPWCLLLSLSYYPIEVSQTTGRFPNTQFEALWSTRNFLADPTEARMRFSSYAQVFLAKGLATGWWFPLATLGKRDGNRKSPGIEEGCVLS